MSVDSPAASLDEGLLRAVVAFCQTLRAAGLAVGPGQTLEFARALGQVESTRQEQFYWAARLSLCLRKEDLPAFDKVFAAFWQRGPDVEDASPPQPRRP